MNYTDKYNKILHISMDNRCEQNRVQVYVG